LQHFACGQRRRIISEPIIIVDYDPRWPLLFEEIRGSVVAALGDIVVAVEHVGSTAVPGLAAKSIIDLDVVVSSVAEIPKAIRRLSGLGYIHQGDLGIAGREAFTPLAHRPRHHLYVCSVDGEELRRHRLFRDYLLAHPDVAAAYGELKKAFALRFSDDRAAYVGAKSAFVADVLRRAASVEV
jgi:GrpB-like predicted nucleotidyltransferase (UPF0157 family)